MDDFYDALKKELFDCESSFITPQFVEKYVEEYKEAVSEACEGIEVELTFDWASFESPDPFDDLEFFK